MLGISEADFIKENNLIYEMGEHLQSWRRNRLDRVFKRFNFFFVKI
jgi:hypothetical protein